MKLKVVLGDMVFEGETGPLEAQGAGAFEYLQSETRKREAALQASFQAWLDKAVPAYAAKTAPPPSLPWTSPQPWPWNPQPIYCADASVPLAFPYKPYPLNPDAVASLQAGGYVVDRLGCPGCGSEAKFLHDHLTPDSRPLCPTCREAAPLEDWKRIHPEGA